MSLDNLASDAALAEASSPGFMEPGAKLKKKRGPKGPWKNKPEGSTAVGSETTPNVALVPPVDPIKELKPLTDQLTIFYSNLLVQIAEDEKASLNNETKEIMSHSTAVCMNQYFPNALGAHASLIVLLCVVGQTSMTAMALRRQNLEKLRHEKKLAEQHGH